MYFICVSSRMEFEQFLLLLNGETSRYNMKLWRKQFEQFSDMSQLYVKLDGFMDFTTQHPRVLWEAMLLQRLFKIYNFGERYWERKMEKFRLVREEMNLKIHV